MSEASNVDTHSKTSGAKPKAKGRFGSSQTSRPHQGHNLVFARVEDPPSMRDKQEMSDSSSAKGQQQTRQQFKPRYKNNQRKVKTGSSEGNWRAREDGTVATSSRQEETFVGKQLDSSQHGRAKAEFEKQCAGEQDKNRSSTTSTSGSNRGRPKVTSEPQDSRGSYRMSYNPDYFKPVFRRDFISDHEAKRSREFKIKANHSEKDKTQQSSRNSDETEESDKTSDVHINDASVDAGTEEKTGTDKSPSLNVHAAPFVPNVFKATSSQRLTSLGKVKQKRKSKAKQDTLRSDNHVNKDRPVETVSEVDMREQEVEDGRISQSASSSKSSGYQQRGNRGNRLRNENSFSKKAAIAEARKYGQTVEGTSKPGSKKERDKKVGIPVKDTLVESRSASGFHQFTEKKPKNPINIANLREYLIDNLVKGSYECAICYGAINQEAAVWNCEKCYHLFHIYCIKKWANTLVAQEDDHKGWRCPTCQEPYASVPNQYRCFCNKIRDPVWNSYDTPHSCGEVCGRKRADNCTHKCNELCHPGPCPPCNAYTSKHCNCGRSYQKVKCSQQVNVRCSLKCDMKRNCGKHVCMVVCHSGDCPPCDEVIDQVCHCGGNKRQITCGSEGLYSEVYSCGRECGKVLSCGKHNCTKPCHSGNCSPCKTSPEVVLTCNCGKVLLADLEDAEPRTLCTDRIPSCGNICGKELSCGSQFKQASSTSIFKRHLCQMICHEGACSCRLTSTVTCQCGNKTCTMPCEEAMKYSASNPYKCEKKCTKKRECGRHRCGQFCCTLTSHPCMQICGRKLSCGIHKCQELCHLGKCPTCYNVSFDELHCHCGVTVMYPPIPCGTRPPECPEICNRLHNCDHPVLHRCHTEENCPPCTVLTTKLCMGGHELRNNVPCWIKELSCGRACERPLPCGDHKCPKTCHKGECGEEQCNQPCPREREACGHQCGARCHKGQNCPNTDCHQKVLLQCRCGNRKEEVFCYMKSKRLATSVLTNRLNELGSGLTITELTDSMARDQLECDKECAQLERNQRVASALQICNPEVLASLAGPQYSEFLKDMARKDPGFISEVETSLSQLVLSSQQSKQQTRSHAFKVMKKTQRQVVHELAEHYSCTSQSYDEEPHRSVVAIAHRGKAKLPAQSLTSFIKSQKQPRPPVPIPINASIQELREKSKKNLQSTDVKLEENKIDYFEMT